MSHKHPAEMTLSEYAERYIIQRELCDFYAKYTLPTKARRFDEWTGKRVPIKDLTPELVSRFLYELQQSGLLSASTIKGYRQGILALWNGASDELACDPPIARRIRRIKVPRVAPVAWTLDEVRWLIKWCQAKDGTTPDGIPHRDYWPALIRVGYDTGLRRGDIIRLRRADIDDDGVIVLTIHKTGVPHVTQVRPTTIAAIDDTFPPPRKVVFPWSATSRLWFRKFRTIVISAGLTGSFKMLRRTSASYIEADHPGMGGRHLGHRTPAIFSAHYEDQRISRRERPLPPDLGGIG